MSPFFNKYRYLGYLVQISGSGVFKKKKHRSNQSKICRTLLLDNRGFSGLKLCGGLRAHIQLPLSQTTLFFCDAKQESIFCDHIDMNMNWIWIKFPRTYMGGLDWSSLFVHKLRSSIDKKIWWMDDGCIIITSYLLSPQHSSTPLAKELNV